MKSMTLLQVKILKMLFLSLFFLGSIGKLYAEKLTVFGKVLDSNGIPIIGVTVIEKGTTNGTTTSENGTYKLLVQGESTLEFHYLGYKTQQVKVNNRKEINLTLQSESIQMDEMIVIAYGTKKKRDLIGSVSKVSGNNLAISSNGSFQNALQGKVAGVNVVNNGVGQSPQIKIRGISSISSGTDPLWVVDGMIGGASDVNVNDIQSVEVLKDASATAIYGSRGSNGVIIVTTKRATTDSKTKININYNFGLTPILNSDLELANTPEYFQMYDYSRSLRNWGPLDTNTDIVKKHWGNYDTQISREEAENINNNYVDLLSRVGKYHDINVSLTQGNKQAANYFSINYRNDETCLEGLSNQRFFARINTDYTKGRVKLGYQISGIYNERKDISSWGGVWSTVPWFQLYNDNIESGYANAACGTGSIGPNLAALIDPKMRRNVTTNFSARSNIYIDYNFKYIDGLNLRLDGSFNYGILQNEYWQSQIITTDATKSTNGSAKKNTSLNQQYHAFFKYIKTFHDHSLDLALGGEWTKGNTDGLYLVGYNLIGTFQEMRNIGSVSPASNQFLYNEAYTINYFSRIDYKFKDRYLLGASFIREGSSKFTPENRWGNFYSVSAGWIISDENFFKNINFISLMKLRGSFGETGNQNISSNAVIASYGTKAKQFYALEPNSFLWNIPNKDIKWEKTQSLDFGIDFGLFQNRLNGSIAYYNQTVNDMLLQSTLPASAGIPTNSFGVSNSIWANVGDMYNRGIEVDLSYKVFTDKNFSWTTNFNITTNHNKVTALEPGLDIKGTGIINVRPGTITKKGLAIGTYYMADWAGVNIDKGYGEIYELDKEKYKLTGETLRTGKKIPATQKNINNNKFILENKTGLPTLFGGWNNEIKYKNLDLSFDIYFSGGNYIYNRARRFGLGDGRSIPFKDWWSESWKKPGDKAKYPQLRWSQLYDFDDNGNPKSNQSYAIPDCGTTAELEKAYFVRLRNVTLGYSFSKNICEKIKISSLRLYLSATNLFTITEFKGYDPEMFLKNQTTAASQGIVFEGGELPQTSIYSFGVNVNF